MNKKRNEIPVDERYLHRFAVLKPKVKTEATSKEGRKKGDFEDDFDDVESVNSDEFNLLLGIFTAMEDIREITDQIDVLQEDDEQLEGGEGASDEEMLGDEDDEGSLESAEDEEGSDEEEYDGIIEGEEGDSDFEDALSFKKQLASGNLDSDSDDDYAQKFDFVGDATKSADKVGVNGCEF
ncbi:unnamed protein product [Anisakis simplex]|uniref:Transposase, mutator type n=1 Tax=Anisakis simplex TaxID=6269 RepID=A0A0M3KFM9_ANISI|nr:unnamed protein product [Anisakis simplex]